MTITRKQFNLYESLRQSGITNMFDTRAVTLYTGLDRETILEIMKGYSGYKAQFEAEIQEERALEHRANDRRIERQLDEDLEAQNLVYGLPDDSDY